MLEMSFTNKVENFFSNNYNLKKQLKSFKLTLMADARLEF